MCNEYIPNNKVSGDVIMTPDKRQRVEILATDERNYSVVIKGDILFSEPVLNTQVDIYSFSIENAEIVINGDVKKALIP